MSSLMRTLIMTSLLWSWDVFARDEFEIIEKRVESSQVRENPETGKLEILVGNVVYTVPTKPSQSDLVSSFGLEGAENLAFKSFDNLSPEDKNLFLNNRIVFLKAIVVTLTMSNFAIGVGTYIGDTFRFLKKVSIQTIKPALGKWGERLEPETEQDLLLRHRAFYQRSYGPIASLLQSINNQMWYQARLVAHLNEIGFVGAIAPVGEHGIARKGIGGLEDIGFSIKYNHAIKGIVFELYHSPEYFKRSVSVTSIMGVNVKFGVVLGTAIVPSQNNADKGFTFYPPGAPSFVETRGSSYAAGFSTSFGWPVGPGVAEIQGWLNSNEKRPMLHVEISPFRLQFIKVISYSPKPSVVHMWARFKDTLAWINEKIKEVRRSYQIAHAPYCRRLL